MNQPDTAVVIPFSARRLPGVYPAETQPGEEDSVQLSSHIDDVLGHVAASQAALPSAQQLLALHMQQINAFLG